MRIISCDPGIRNLGYIDFEVEGDQINVLNWGCVDFLRKNGCTIQNCRNVTTERTLLLLREQLDSEYKNLVRGEVDEIVVEAQTGDKEGATANFILGYFASKGAKPRILSAMSKFKYRVPDIKKRLVGTKAQRHKQLKDISIEEASDIVAAGGEHLRDFWSSVGKVQQEHVADALLQGLTAAKFQTKEVRSDKASSVGGSKAKRKLQSDDLIQMSPQKEIVETGARKRCCPRLA